MRITLKALVIITAVFLIKLTFSCCNCTEQVAEYQYDNLLISNLNNSEWSANLTDYNAMEAAAIAFEMKLVDSSFRPPIDMARAQLPKLTSAMAMQPCECPFHLFLRNEIDSLSIITLRDFSKDVPAGTDIIKSFVWQVDHNHMYNSIDSLLAKMNESYYDYSVEPERAYELFCRDSVESDSLQLVFRLKYSNGDILTDTTNVIAIRRSGREVEL